jgi:outer membrane protein
MKVKALVLGTTMALAALSATSALAYEAGDIIVRAGVANVSPDESSDKLHLVGSGNIAGSGVEVDDDTQLGLTATYMFSDSLGIELLAATPFTHDITANTGELGLGKVDAGEVTHLPPTVSVVWYPIGSAGSISPYIGGGLNYTMMLEDKTSSTLDGALNADLGLELDDSWGVAFQGGVDFALNENWHINASVRWIDIETEAKITAGNATVIKIDNIELDPWVYQLNIGYKF